MMENADAQVGEKTRTMYCNASQRTMKREASRFEKQSDTIHDARKRKPASEEAGFRTDVNNGGKLSAC